MCCEGGKPSRSSSRSTGEEGNAGSLLEFLRQQMRKIRRKDGKNKTREADEGKQEKRSSQEDDGVDEGEKELLLDTEEAVKCILKKDQEDHAPDDEEENPLRDALTKRLSGFSSTEQVNRDVDLSLSNSVFHGLAVFLVLFLCRPCVSLSYFSSPFFLSFFLL